MTTTHHLLQLAYPRIHALGARLRAAVWQDVGLPEVDFAGASSDHISWQEAQHKKFRPVQLPWTWGKLFDQAWFRVHLPRRLPAGPLYLQWMDQGEGTLYHQGVPFYGFDVAHRTAPLPPGLRGGETLWVEGLCLQSAIWHPEARGLNPQGSVLSRVALLRRDETAWSAWHDYLVLVDMLQEAQKSEFPQGVPSARGVGHHPAVEEVSVFYRRLLRMLDDSVQAYDFGGVPACAGALRRTLDAFRGRAQAITAVLTGHAHIDLVWLWPERVGEYKAVHTFATMNQLLGRYPEMRFAYSQPASYEAVARRAPALMSQVQKRIRLGQWEAAGAAYVESDTLLACGEALARSLTVGQGEFEKLQGRQSPIMWLPDVFGYSPCLPQLMRQSGVDYFFTTKLTWSNVTRFPHSSFWWKGSDGSCVLAHVTQGNGYNQTASATELLRGARAYRQSDVHGEFLAPTGYGDGGGGVTEEMCERARRLANLESMPRVRWGRLDEFFRNLAKAGRRLPQYEGELYLEYHRGTYTTHHALKSAFREAERALQVWEAAVCLSNSRHPIPLEVWKRMIFAQFHDYIPGSSIAEVYHEAIPELESIARGARHQARKEVEQTGGEACWWNPCPLRRWVVRERRQGRIGLAQLPPLSVTPITALKTERTTAAPFTRGRRLESARVAAELGPDGTIRHFSVDGAEVPVAEPLGQLISYPDFPHAFDAWDIDRQTLCQGQLAVKKLRQGEAKPGEMVFTGALDQDSEIRIVYRVDEVLPVLHIEYEITWREKNRLLQAHFPTRCQGLMARYGAPFGSVLRLQQPRGPAQEAQFEVPGSRYAMVGDDSGLGGLVLITESKYGFSCQEGRLSVSLLRSPRVTGEAGESHSGAYPEEIRRLKSRSTHADQGIFRVRLALSHVTAQTLREEQPAALADLIYQPPVRVNGSTRNCGFLGLEGGESLVPCWARPLGQGVWELRLHEVMGQAGKCRVRVVPGWRIRRTDLMGRPVRGLSGQVLRFGPSQIITLRFQPQ